MNNKQTCKPILAITIFLVSVFCILTVSCASSLCITQKELFFKNNPDVASYYTKLDVTSVGSMKTQLLEEKSHVLALLRSLRRDNKSNDDVLKQINQLEENYKKSYQRREDRLDEINEKELQANDEIYLYEYKDKKKFEYGVLILNCGEVRNKFVEHSETVK